jgi:hypothetical protein
MYMTGISQTEALFRILLYDLDRFSRKRLVRFISGWLLVSLPFSFVRPTCVTDRMAKLIIELLQDSSSN